MRAWRVLWLVVPVLASPLSASADRGQPWSEIAVGNVASRDDGEQDVWMTMINGSRDFPDAARYTLAPGTNALRLTSRKRGRGGEHTSLPVTLELRPCMRYALVADHAGEASGQPWRVKVAAETAIKGCLRRFGSAPAGTPRTAAP